VPASELDAWSMYVLASPHDAFCCCRPECSPKGPREIFVGERRIAEEPKRDVIREEFEPRARARKCGITATYGGGDAEIRTVDHC
jgi:hypothetical protein